MKSVLARCLAAVNQDGTVARLLDQIVYQHPRAGVTPHGKGWIIKTRPGWMEETGLSLDQYNRALKLLKVGGLVEVDLHKHKGVPTTHLRLTQTGINVFEGGLVPDFKGREENKQSILARCLGAVAQDLTTARLLHHIAYWHPRCRWIREGRSWIVKTRAEWQAETDLTPKQYARALRVLKNLALVEVRQWKKDPTSDCPTTFLKLSNKGSKLVLGIGSGMGGSYEEPEPAGPLVGPGTTNPSAPEPANPKAQNGSVGQEPHTPEIPPEGYNQGAQAEAHSPSKLIFQVIFQGTFTARPLTWTRNTAPTLPDSKKAEAEDEEADWEEETFSGGSLAWGVWQATVAAYYTGTPSASAKDKRALTAFAEDLPDPLEPANSIRQIIMLWELFADRVRLEMGLEELPEAPNLGFLLKHQKCAHGFLTDIAALQAEQGQEAAGQTQQILPAYAEWPSTQAYQEEWEDAEGGEDAEEGEDA